MKEYIYLIAGWLVLVSIAAVIMTTDDKSKAIYGKRRISEASLLTIAALGGSVAMYITMLTVRHKTRHAKFMVGIPVIVVLQAALLAIIFLNFT